MIRDLQSYRDSIGATKRASIAKSDGESLVMAAGKPVIAVATGLIKWDGELPRSKTIIGTSSIQGMAVFLNIVGFVSNLHVSRVLRTNRQIRVERLQPRKSPFFAIVDIDSGSTNPKDETMRLVKALLSSRKPSKSGIRAKKLAKIYEIDETKEFAIKKS